MNIWLPPLIATAALAVAIILFCFHFAARKEASQKPQNRAMAVSNAINQKPYKGKS